MNSKWRIHRVGLVDFWYYDEEEFTFLDGRMLLRGANGSGKSVTMQSFIPLLLDGNMRPERLDPFGSRARKMENYLLEEGDEREERTGYLYMELKRTESDEYLTLGIGLRARRNKRLEAWYFCITDGRRIGKDFWLYKELHSKVTCSMRELRNRIGEGGRVMETQSEYAQCVNRLLFGFETQEEYRELLELLIQLRTPKLSKDFKPTIINEILSGSLQTLSEDDLRPMSEAIENMDGLKTNLDALSESIRAAEQMEKVYDQYNEVVLCDKARLFTEAARECRTLEKKAQELETELGNTRSEAEQERARHEELGREESVLRQEQSSLADSDAARLARQEQQLKEELEELETAIEARRRQEEEKEGKRQDTERQRRKQEEKSEQLREDMKERLEEMEEQIEGLSFDDFSFMRTELWDAGEKPYSFAAHEKLLQEYRNQVEAGKAKLQEEKLFQERYSLRLQDLDRIQEERNNMEREGRRRADRLHEEKQELTERVYQWRRECRELCPEEDALQEISRRIESCRSDTDYWGEIRDQIRPSFEERERTLAAQTAEKKAEQKAKQAEYEESLEELEQWQTRKEPEPEHSEAVTANRRRLEQEGIPYHCFYRLVDFDGKLPQKQAAELEEALLHMGILDALVVPAEYRQRVLQLDPGVCDRYIFTDAAQVRSNLMELLDIDNEDNDILLYQNISRALSAIGWQEKAGSWIEAGGHYGMGVLEGTITGTYTPRFIGVRSRENYRREKIRELEEICRLKEQELAGLRQELETLEERRGRLGQEWAAFPEGKALKECAREYEAQEKAIEEIGERIRAQKELVEKARRELDEIRLAVQEISRKCELSPRLDVFAEAAEALAGYQKNLTLLQIAHRDYINGSGSLRLLEAHLEEIDADLDTIRYDLGGSVRKKKEKEALLISVQNQLKLTDYEKIRERMEYCLRRLRELPLEKEGAVRRMGELEMQEKVLAERRQENQIGIGKARLRREWLGQAFGQELHLGYVERTFAGDGDREEQAVKICGALGGKSGGRKQSDLFGSLQEVYHRNRGWLLEYQITLQTLFEELDEENSFSEMGMKRLDLRAKYRGTPVKFKELLARLREDEQTQKRLLSDKDRELFEDILTNTISKKIRLRIQASRRWVEKMNALMESMQTSSGLTLSLRWKHKRAEKEEQLDTKALVELLQKDAEIMRPEEAQQLSAHFRSKIEEARKTVADAGNVQSFHAIMREVLDYRQWFEFQLECQKTGEKKKELTDRVFFTFSGGEKAMAMYVPLFSAVVAKYAGAREDAPRLISLDEAFAGVDEMNIRDMFRLMSEFGFNFMINSQILWGDYDTVPALAIYQLVRPENARYVTVIRYVWNGMVRRIVTEAEMEREAEEVRASGKGDGVRGE
ncbi:MAG: TIGR02680 family protein [Eubacteriales bacterium]|nr:TIGR02680 family protein [Eubacteriales bacterium]